MPDTLLGGIAINEILVDPNGTTYNFDTDGNGTADHVDEYIELVNTSGAPIDISGLELWDAGIGNWFTFPTGTILQPGAHALVMSGLQTGGSFPAGGPDDLFFEAGRTGALINNGGDNVVVYDPTNDEYIQATFNGDTLDDPTLYTGFSATATRSGTGEDFGFDTDGLSLQRQYDTWDSFVLAAPTPGIANVCFCAGTMISTPSGQVPVETLQAGDIIDTLDRGPQPVSWVFAAIWAPGRVRRNDNLKPVRISAQALGEGLPKRALLVSQQHRILVRGPIAERMFGVAEVLVAAKHLCQLDGIDIVEPRGPVVYYHVMTDGHDVLIANGAPAESLFLGQQTFRTIPERGLRELEALLGRSISELAKSPPAFARPVANGKRALHLIDRHVKNRKPLLQDAA